jgi:hypothetical protein
MAIEKLIVARDGSVVREACSSEEIAAAASLAAFDAARASKESHNIERINTLGIIAAKYAKGGTTALTARQTHELLSRLALSVAADDQ